MPKWSPREGAHPDLETLSAFVDGRLSISERDEVEAHLVSCDECFDLVSEVMSARPYELDPAQAAEYSVLAPPGVMPFYRRKRTLWTVAALTTAAALVIVVMRLQPEWFGRQLEDAQLAQLVAAVGDARYVEGRLSGGFGYGQLQGARRSGSVAQQNLSLLAAAGALQKAAQAEPTAENLHAYGVAQLLLGDYDRAVDNLEAAVAEAPADAAYLNDLAVAYNERGSRVDRADDFPKAYESADRALTLDPALMEAAFTRALALERLGLRERARAAWEDYLSRDAESAWAAEARQRLATLQAAPPQARWRSLGDSIASASLPDSEIASAVRDVPDVIPELLLAHWSDARAPFLRRVATQFRERTGDDSLVRALDRAGDASARTPALEDLARGYRLLNEDRYLEAEPHLRAAVAGLDHHPLLSGWARFALARVRYFRGDLAGSLSDLELVQQRAASHQATALRARAHWISGIVHFSMGDWSAARREYLAAISTFNAAHDAQGVATVHVNLSILSRFLGDRVSVWRHRMAALQQRPLHRPTLDHGFLVTSAVTASLEDLPGTALMFFDEAVQNAGPGMPAYTRAETLLQRARIYNRLGQHDNAERDLERARFEWSMIEDEAIRERVELSVLTASAQVRQQRQPQHAVTDARHAIARASARGDLLRSAELHLYLSRALSALEDRSGARQAIEQGIADFYKARQSLPADDPTRLSTVEPVWELFDEAVQLHGGDSPVDRGALFRAMESSRAHTLRELRVDDTVDLDDVRAQLPAGRALLLFHQQAGALRVWVIEQHQDSMVTVPVSAREARALVGAYERRLTLGASTADVAARLSQAVLRPVLSQLPTVTSIIVVPDEPFTRLPWAALPDPASGDALVERLAISLAPSAALAVAHQQEAPERARALVVVASDADSELPVLAGAREEAEGIARVYANATVADGAAASGKAVLQKLPHFPIVHIAAHAVNNSAYPLLSRLALYPDEKNDVGLRVADLLRAPRLLPSSLVVLAACSTGGVVTRRGEGAVGLAWGFLAAGAASVVATLWDVDDRAVSPLFVDFHRHVASGMRPSEALRAAQRAARGRGQPEHVWASLQLVGQP